MIPKATYSSGTELNRCASFNPSNIVKSRAVFSTSSSCFCFTMLKVVPRAHSAASSAQLTLCASWRRSQPMEQQHTTSYRHSTPVTPNLSRAGNTALWSLQRSSSPPHSTFTIYLQSAMVHSATKGPNNIHCSNSTATSFHGPLFLA